MTYSVRVPAPCATLRVSQGRVRRRPRSHAQRHPFLICHLPTPANGTATADRPTTFLPATATLFKSGRAAEEGYLEIRHQFDAIRYPRPVMRYVAGCLSVVLPRRIAPPFANPNQHRIHPRRVTVHLSSHHDRRLARSAKRDQLPRCFESRMRFLMFQPILQFLDGVRCPNLLCLVPDRIEVRPCCAGC
jgi:hypothetical protein